MTAPGVDVNLPPELRGFTAKYAEHADGAAEPGEAVHLQGECVFCSNLFRFRVVRVVRGSN